MAVVEIDPRVRLEARVAELEAMVAALEDQLAAVAVSASVIDAHVVKMRELNAVQHRVIMCAVAGDLAPARRYAEVEKRLAAEGSRGG